MLIVEDDPILLSQMIQFVRKELRMNPLGAEDYYRAILQLEQGPIDLASIDLRLPRESGYDLCVYLRAKPASKEIPILVTGEQAVPADLAQAEEAGANLFLEKPFSMRELAVHVAALIERPKLSRPGLRFLRLF
jgi:two-component system phosphate regulon response regulator PhoB